MEKRKTEKIASLVVSFLAFALLFGNSPLHSVGIYAECDIASRLLYSFYHVNVIHAMLNVWCFLSVVFMYNVSVWRLLLSYLTAISIPSCFLGNTPTVGLSAAVFFLFASISFEVIRKWNYQMWMLFYLAVGFIFPNTNAMVHLYCYSVGMLYALLNKPIAR